MTRWVYNFGLSLFKQAFDAKETLPKFVDLANKLPRLKRESETEWLKQAHSQILQQSLKDLEQATKHFFRRLKLKRGKPGFPRFKKRGFRDSFRYPQGTKIANGAIYLPKIGWVAYRDSWPIEGKVKQVTVKREGDHWFVNIMCEITAIIKQVIPSVEKTVGIDLGLKKFAYVSDGHVVENPTFLKKELNKLRTLQRGFSRKQKGSRNQSKLAKKVGSLHVRIKNKRKDFLHKITTELVKNHDVLVVEDLNVKGMVRNRRLSRAISDAGWHLFGLLLNYKCSWYGKYFVKINRFLPTSKECSSCHALQDMPLNIRTYSCTSCGLNLDRDLNASKNIRAAGLSVLQKACGGNGVGFPHEARISGF